MDNCSLCYHLKAQSCYGSLHITAGLTHNHSYTVFLEDHHGHFHTQSVTSDNSGNFSLDLTAFPEGMFTAFSGTYELSVSTSAVSSTYETITIAAATYDCIAIDFVDVD